MKKVLVFGLLIVLTLAGVAAFIWFQTQPVWAVNKKVEPEVLNNLPVTNKKIIQFIEANGPALAPTYQASVCTEFVIDVISNQQYLTTKEKNTIRIITPAALDSLIDADSPVIKGVQTALVQSEKGVAVNEFKDVLPGDFVQFWNVFQGKGYGHCGIVLNIDPGKTITLYSSHPFTEGYGTQKYLWPEKIYFARLK